MESETAPVQPHLTPSGPSHGVCPVILEELSKRAGETWSGSTVSHGLPSSTETLTMN